MTDESIWAAIAAAGPREDSGGFDPYTTDDVLAAERSGMQYERRKSFVASYAWSIPTPEAIRLIATVVARRKLLEVCAGSGLWAKLLTEAGVEVIATDLGPPPHLHYPIEKMDGEAAVKHHADCEALMVCWPPMKSDIAARALQAFAGDLFIYIGDRRFTGDRKSVV